MKVGIIGYGIIGQATASLFQDVVVYDPLKGYHDTSGLSNCNLVFVCVPTPTVNGRSDLTTLQTVLDELVPRLGIDIELSDVIRFLVSRGHRFHTCNVSGCFWADVDTEEDLNRVRV